MDLNRNQWFMYGVLILLIGLELRMTESFVLNEKTSQFIAQQMHSQELASAGPIKAAYIQRPPESRRTIKLPRWLGLSLISVGSVLMLHAIAMRKQ